MKFQIVLTILMGFGLSAHAEPLKFKSWKEQQIVEAQNEVLRISARLRSQKSNFKVEKNKRSDIDLTGSNRFQDASEVTDRDLKMAQDSLEIAKEFSLQDYADVYVTGLQNDPEQFGKLMASLSRDEMTQLMKILVKIKPQDADQAPTNDAKHNKGPTPSALVSSTSHS